MTHYINPPPPERVRHGWVIYSILMMQGSQWSSLKIDTRVHQYQFSFTVGTLKGMSKSRNGVSQTLLEVPYHYYRQMVSHILDGGVSHGI